MKKLLLSSVLAGTLFTSANAWDFCSDGSQIGVAATGMGAGVLIADATFGGVPGLIVGAIANQLLCTPVKVEDATEPKLEIGTGLKTSPLDGAKTVYFDFDKYTLNDAGKDAVKTTSEAIKTVKEPIRIEGHADARGSDEYNYALGLKRATEVKQRLIAEGSMNTFQVVSYGESAPACTESTEDCFAKNRRVQFKIAE